MNQYQELKNRRRAFFDKMDDIDSPKSLLDFQLALAEEIKDSERAQKKERDVTRAWHIHLLRCYGDSLTWKMLHPHTIRQLAKNDGRPPFLIDQEEAFNFTVETAEMAVDQDIPVLLSDLTNCIRVGDLVLPRVGEHTVIIECKTGKTSEKFSLQGRRGRQFRRMKSIENYLNGEWEEVFGGVQIAVGGEVEERYNWGIVNELCLRAFENGFASKMVSDNEWIFVVNKMEGKAFLHEMIKGQLNPQDFVVAFHFDAVREPWPTICSHLNWDINKEVKLMLLEGDLVLIHAFNPHSLIGYGTPKGKIVDVLELPYFYGHGYKVEVGNKQIMATSNFIMSVIYGYEKVESMAERLFETASVFKELDMDIDQPLSVLIQKLQGQVTG